MLKCKINSLLIILVFVELISGFNAHWSQREYIVTTGEANECKEFSSPDTKTSYSITWCKYAYDRLTQLQAILVRVLLRKAVITYFDFEVRYPHCGKLSKNG